MSAIRPPARLARGKMLVRIRDARVVLFAVLILRRIRIRIPPQPEVLDELVALFVVAQALERLQLLVGDDPANVLIHPLLVLALQLRLQRLLLARSSPCRSADASKDPASPPSADPCVTPSVWSEPLVASWAVKTCRSHADHRQRRAVQDTKRREVVIEKGVHSCYQPTL